MGWGFIKDAWDDVRGVVKDVGHGIREASFAFTKPTAKLGDWALNATHLDNALNINFEQLNQGMGGVVSGMYGYNYGDLKKGVGEMSGGSGFEAAADSFTHKVTNLDHVVGGREGMNKAGAFGGAAAAVAAATVVSAFTAGALAPAAYAGAATIAGAAIGSAAGSAAANKHGGKVNKELGGKEENISYIQKGAGTGAVLGSLYAGGMSPGSLGFSTAGMGANLGTAATVTSAAAGANTAFKGDERVSWGLTAASLALSAVNAYNVGEASNSAVDNGLASGQDVGYSEMSQRSPDVATSNTAPAAAGGGMPWGEIAAGVVMAGGMALSMFGSKVGSGTGVGGGGFDTADAGFNLNSSVSEDEEEGLYMARIQRSHGGSAGYRAYTN